MLGRACTYQMPTLALENSIPRNRAIAQIVSAGAKLLEVGDHEERLRTLESTQEARRRSDAETAAFPDDGS